eukprot:11197057-Lingulodinium_polyedra.AAC.1
MAAPVQQRSPPRQKTSRAVGARGNEFQHAVAGPRAELVARETLAPGAQSTRCANARPPCNSTG